jgi:hypothetical protein
MSRMCNTKRARQSRGTAMLLVLIAVAVCTILALSFLASQEPTAVVASNIDRKTQARAIAESALKMAIDYVNEDADWRTDKSSGVWMTDVALDGGTFTLTGTDEIDGDLADDTAEAVTLSVVATYAGVTHRVSAVVSPGGDGPPGTKLLLVVGDSGSPSSQDVAKQTLFEKWGYTVTLIDDGATQAAFDAAVALNDIAYISNSCSDTAVGTKLTDAAIGVLSEVFRLVDDLGLQNNEAGGSATGTAINVLDDTHMITEGYAIGSHTIVNSSTTFTLYSGLYAAGVKVLADNDFVIASFEHPTLLVADRGSMLHTGVAAGRRVALPFQPATFDVNELTMDGQTILWRCLQWAGGANSVPPMRIALYEFAEQPVADPTLVGHWSLDEDFGVSTEFGNNSAGNGSDSSDNDTVASKFVLTTPMSVTGITTRLKRNKDGHFRCAIYEDNSGSPGDLISETAKTQFSENGWAWRTASIGPVELEAGTYWLALSAEGANTQVEYNYQDHTGTTHHNSQDAINDGFNTTWGTSDATYTRELSIYLEGISSPYAEDQAISENSGDYQGAPIGGETGFGDGGTSVTFHGINDYLEIPHDDAYLLNEGSVGLHFRPASTSGEQGLFSKDSSGNDNGGHLYLYLDGTRLKARINTDGSNPYGTGDSIELQSGSGSISTNTWHHVLVTFGDGQFRLYLDGTLVDAGNHLGGLGTTSGGSGNTEPIVIGANSEGSDDVSATPISNEFEGRIDDVRIYGLPLDATQAANIASGSALGTRAAPGYVITDTSGYEDPANLIIYDTSAINWVGGGGLQFTGDTIATSIGAVSKFKDAIEDNDAFAIELILERASSDTTASPSYLFGNSNAPFVHNFLIGQSGTKYVARVRDSATGTSGVLSPELISNTNLPATGETHLQLSYKAGELSVYIDGVLDMTASTGGTVDNWADDLLVVLGGAYSDTDHWNGTIKRIAVYDRGFNAVQARNVYNGNPPGDGSGSISTVRWHEDD